MSVNDISATTPTAFLPELQSKRALCSLVMVFMLAMTPDGPELERLNKKREN